MIHYYGLDGEPVKRTPRSHPYSYDDFVVYKSDDFDRVKTEMVYSDRLFGRSAKRFAFAAEAVWGNESTMFYNRAPEDINRFLNLYFGREVKLTVVLQGCNARSGYPYWVFGYTKEKGKLL